MTPLDLFYIGGYAIIIAAILCLVIFIIGAITQSDPDVVIGVCFLTIGMAVVVLIVSWVGAIVLAVIQAV
jgi:hypothetical protein